MKKLTTLATVMALLLVAFAPLVLAQQEAAEIPPAEEPPPAVLPPTAPPPFELVLEDPFSLNEDSDLVLDCDAVFRNLALLNSYRDTSLASNPEFQANLAETEGLSQICVDAGLASFGQTSDDSESTSVEQYQYEE